MSPETLTVWISKPGTSHCTSTRPARSAAEVSAVHVTSTSLTSEPSDKTLGRLAMDVMVGGAMSQGLGSAVFSA